MTALIRNNVVQVATPKRCATTSAAPVIQSKHCAPAHVDAFVRQSVTQSVRLNVNVQVLVEQRVTKETHAKVRLAKPETCAHVARQTAEKVTKTVAKPVVRAHAEKLAASACHHASTAHIDLHATAHVVKQVFEAKARRTFELSVKRSETKRCGCERKLEKKAPAEHKSLTPVATPVRKPAVEHVVRQTSELAVRQGCEQVLKHQEVKPMVQQATVVVEKPVVQKPVEERKLAPVKAPPAEVCGCDDDAMEKEAFFWTLAGLIIGFGALLISEAASREKAPAPVCGCGDEKALEPAVAAPTPTVEPLLGELDLTSLFAQSYKAFTTPDLAPRTVAAAPEFALR